MVGHLPFQNIAFLFFNTPVPPGFVVTLHHKETLESMWALNGIVCLHFILSFKMHVCDTLLGACELVLRRPMFLCILFVFLLERLSTAAIRAALFARMSWSMPCVFSSVYLLFHLCGQFTEHMCMLTVILKLFFTLCVDSAPRRLYTRICVRGEGGGVSSCHVWGLASDWRCVWGKVALIEFRHGHFNGHHILVIFSSNF